MADENEGTTGPLWPGDKGQLPVAARRCLCRLLRSTAICEADDPEDWAQFKEHREAIESRMNDVLVRLVYDPQRKAAFGVRPQMEVAGAADSLKSAASYPFHAMAVVQYIASKAYAGEREGLDAVYVTEAEAKDHVKTLAEGTPSERKAAGELSKVSTFMKGTLADEQRLLVEDEGREGVYRVSPAFLAVFGHEALASVLNQARAEYERRDGDAA